MVQSATLGVSMREDNSWVMDTSELEETNTNKIKSKEILDVDSGIENMEVEESERKEFENTEINRVSSSNEGNTEKVVTTISRILCVSWNEQNEGTVLLPANNVLFNTDALNPDYQDLISQSLMEILCQFASGLDPLHGVPQNVITPNDVSPSSPDLPSTPVNSTCLPDNCYNQNNITKQTDGLYYLMNCYSRVSLEERNHPKVQHAF